MTNLMKDTDAIWVMAGGSLVFLWRSCANRGSWFRFCTHTNVIIMFPIRYSDDFAFVIIKLLLIRTLWRAFIHVRLSDLTLFPEKLSSAA